MKMYPSDEQKFAVINVNKYYDSRPQPANAAQATLSLILVRLRNTEIHFQFLISRRWMASAVGALAAFNYRPHARPRLRGNVIS